MLARVVQLFQTDIVKFKNAAGRPEGGTSGPTMQVGFSHVAGEWVEVISDGASRT